MYSELCRVWKHLQSGVVLEIKLDLKLDWPFHYLPSLTTFSPLLIFPLQWAFVKSGQIRCSVASAELHLALTRLCGCLERSNSLQLLMDKLCLCLHSHLFRAVIGFDTCLEYKLQGYICCVLSLSPTENTCCCFFSRNAICCYVFIISSFPSSSTEHQHSFLPSETWLSRAWRRNLGSWEVKTHAGECGRLGAEGCLCDKDTTRKQMVSRGIFIWSFVALQLQLGLVFLDFSRLPQIFCSSYYHLRPFTPTSYI